VWTCEPWSKRTQVELSCELFLNRCRDGAIGTARIDDREVAYHQQVTDALEDTLVPGATNQELKALLEQAPRRSWRTSSTPNGCRRRRHTDHACRHPGGIRGDDDRGLQVR